MDNKILGAFLILLCILLAFMVFSYNNTLQQAIQEDCACTDSACPHEQNPGWQTYVSIIILSTLGALGVYLIFFDKSQREIAFALNNQKRMSLREEKFRILMKGLSPEEQKVMESLREQNGISQYTLRLRTGLHKSKLSIVLEWLEKKELITRQVHGKSKLVFLKIAL